MSEEIPYSHAEGILQFQKEIRAVIERSKDERDLFVADMIGVLEMEKMNLYNRIPNRGLDE